MHNEYRVPFPRVKRPGRFTDYPFPSTAEVEYGIRLLYACLARKRDSF
jgi:hypothetical protein